MCLHADRGDRVSVVFLSSGELALRHLPCEEARRVRETEAEAAAAVLGVAALSFLRAPDWFLGDHVEEAAAAVARHLARETPDLVYLPHTRDGHPDHRAAMPIVEKALNRCGLSGTGIMAYEVWTPLADYQHVEDVSAVMGRKVDSIREYRSQQGPFSYEQAVTGLNQYRGALAGRCSYAEVFAVEVADGWVDD